MGRRNSRPTLFLVRHGAAEDADDRIVGQVDLPLSTAGADSIARLAATWTGPPPSRIWSSDLHRASASAAILAERWNTGLETDRRLREIDFGAWDGERWQDIRKRDRPAFDRFMDQWYQKPPPGGETFDAVDRRVHAWLEEAWTSDLDRPVVVVAHGGSIRALLCRALGMPARRVFHLHLDHGKVSALDVSWRGTEVSLLNAGRFPPR